MSEMWSNLLWLSALGVKSRHVKFAEKTQKFSETEQLFTVQLEDAPSLAHGLGIGNAKHLASYTQGESINIKVSRDTDRTAGNAL